MSLLTVFERQTMPSYIYECVLLFQMMGDKQKEDEQINEILKDWKMLAQKADFVLFWIFFIITTFTR